MSTPRTDTPQPGRVLIVDDSALVRHALRALLERGGFSVDEADQGLAARDAIGAGHYDVVLTDLRMPLLDGFGLMEALTHHPDAPEFIVLTGAHADDVRSAVRALRLGAHDFFLKPPDDPDQVLDSVRAAVDKRRLRGDNARLLRELDRLSRTDALTGAGNRRAFDEALRLEAARSQRYGMPVSLVLLDLDRFKRVNDEHGHAIGDGVLRWFVDLASTRVREVDAVYRYGGEEFALLLPHTPLPGAVDVAERLVARVRTTPCVVDGVRLDVTCSAGVATLLGSDPRRGELVASADRALYAAKRAGRDRVVADGPRLARRGKLHRIAG